jgi:hypothetical protein
MHVNGIFDTDIFFLPPSRLKFGLYRISFTAYLLCIEQGAICRMGRRMATGL